MQPESGTSVIPFRFAELTQATLAT